MTTSEREQEIQRLINLVIKKAYSQIDRAVLRAAIMIYDNEGTLPYSASGKIMYQSIFDDLNKQLDNIIPSGIVTANDLANNHIDESVLSYLGDKTISDSLKEQYFKHESSALNAQLNRAIDGNTLSDRVWAIANSTQQGIEEVIYSDIGEAFVTGKSATSIATGLKQFLNNPDKRFRRVRDENGKLVASKPMENFHPGQGVYRSSYKNALRLSANEINMSYRMAEHERIQNLDFVTGYEVHTSNNHPKEDICDEMKGKYPKEFVFRGWHTLCRCYVTTILIPVDDFSKYLSGDVESVNDLGATQVENIPTNAQKYVDENKAMFEGWKNQPYFLSDNSDFFSE